ncbi:transcriptional coactivator p15/PC4 family protein [Bradyrhizobium diazoefficiens]|nr:transcriptional coactivator p15/PC4 family protein [Bradyrhizobium diazoefficiens]QQN62124.1 transcriptional coactivator p15/PC4 family protein [Bradyrhizobium diazoefficiens]
MGKRPELVEPVIVDRFFSNRRKDVITTTLQTFKGHALVDLRKHVHDREGKIHPTTKGITMKVTRLPELAKAIGKALEQARALGLLNGEDAE